MYAVSFRIPFTIMGRKQFVNGSARSDKEFHKGDPILVADKSMPSKPAVAEVIDS